MVDDLLRELIAEVRGLRADFRRARARDLDLDLAWRETIGPAPMTTGVLLDLCADDPRDPLAVAIAAAVDLAAPGRAVSLGRLLARQSWLRAERRGNVLLYRLADRD